MNIFLKRGTIDLIYVYNYPAYRDEMKNSDTGIQNAFNEKCLTYNIFDYVAAIIKIFKRETKLTECKNNLKKMYLKSYVLSHLFNRKQKFKPFQRTIIHQT